MKINKKEVTRGLIIILFVLSTGLLLYKVIMPATTTCYYKEEEPLYQKKVQLTLKYKKDQVSKIIYKEIFKSEEESILEMKTKQFEKENAKVKVEKNKVESYKEEKVNASYTKSVEQLLQEGFTCK